MFSFFYPTAYYRRIFDIPLKMLKKNGIKGLVFDVDNTLSPYNEAEPNDETIAFIKKASAEGFSICLLSNNTKKRVKLYNEKLNLHCVYRACKPSRRGLKKAMALMSTKEAETVIIGDQIFTDVWCGKRAGVRSILVEPCSQRDVWFVYLKRMLEKAILREYLSFCGNRNRKR